MVVGVDVDVCWMDDALCTNLQDKKQTEKDALKDRRDGKVRLE